MRYIVFCAATGTEHARPSASPTKKHTHTHTHTHAHTHTHTQTGFEKQVQTVWGVKTEWSSNCIITSSNSACIREEILFYRPQRTRWQGFHAWNAQTEKWIIADEIFNWLIYIEIHRVGEQMLESWPFSNDTIIITLSNLTSVSSVCSSACGCISITLSFSQKFQLNEAISNHQLWHKLAMKLFKAIVNVLAIDCINNGRNIADLTHWFVDCCFENEHHAVLKKTWN